ncbi:MAG: DUF6273 domain-containing protein [Bacilli bacterium]|nr:DUF6273 domain-containing protein [Bacilli bacterium]
MKKKIILIPAFIAGMTLIACGGGNEPGPGPTPPGPGPEPTEQFEITLNSKTLTISSTALEEGKDFNGTVTMKEGLISKYDMPVTLGNIQVQGAEDIKYTDYTYNINPDLESANIVIPGKFITGNLKIIAEAELIQHKLIFSESDAFRVTKPTVGKNESLDTDIIVKDYWKDYVNLPTKDKLGIKIGGKDLGSGDFEYNIVAEGEKAHLKIDASLIVDDIIVSGQVTPAAYDVKISGDETVTHLKINEDKATVATDFNATISVTDETHVLPSTIKITCKDAQTQRVYEIPSISGYYYSSGSGALTVYHRCVYGPLTIEAVAEEAAAVLETKTSIDETKLEFYKDSEFKDKITQPIKIQVSELDQGYSIYVKSTDNDYIVPSTFDITVDGEKVVGYSVKYGGIPSPIKGDKHYATLTIQKDCVLGHVVVYGVGQVESRHVVKTVTAYLETSALPEYISVAQELQCIFTPTGEHNLPLVENVNIKIADVWYDGNGYNDDGGHIGITYDSNIGKLVISKEATELAFRKEGSDIEIIAKPADVSVLKELTTGTYKEWETLHALSMYGYKLFTPGETTGDFYLTGYKYPFQARLIGFAQERGSTDTGYVQGLTLEFTTAISQAQYYQDKTNNNIYYKKDFAGTFESNLYKVLNGTGGIVDKLPANLKKNLYQVTKYGLTSDGSNKLNSLNYLYPLSLSEMNEKVITTDLDGKYLKESANGNNVVYDYYKKFKTAEELKLARIKGYQDLGASAYWLRTPDLDAENKDFNITIQGGTTTNAQTTKGIAPAFCI